MIKWKKDVQLYHNCVNRELEGELCTTSFAAIKTDHIARISLLFANPSLLIPSMAASDFSTLWGYLIRPPDKTSCQELLIMSNLGFD